jgi:hypothetical protein
MVPSITFRIGIREWGIAEASWSTGMRYVYDVAYDTITYDRTALYEEVSTAPVRDIAKRYKVSDVALSKTCRKLGIPLPPQGYWLRPEKKRGARPPLPPPK